MCWRNGTSCRGLGMKRCSMFVGRRQTGIDIQGPTREHVFPSLASPDGTWWQQMLSVSLLGISSVKAVVKGRSAFCPSGRALCSWLFFLLWNILTCTSFPASTASSAWQFRHSPSVCGYLRCWSSAQYAALDAAVQWCWQQQRGEWHRRECRANVRASCGKKHQSRGKCALSQA